MKYAKTRSKRINNTAIVSITIVLAIAIIVTAIAVPLLMRGETGDDVLYNSTVTVRFCDEIGRDIMPPKKVGYNLDEENSAVIYEEVAPDIDGYIHAGTGSNSVELNLTESEADRHKTITFRYQSVSTAYLRVRFVDEYYRDIIPPDITDCGVGETLIRQAKIIPGYELTGSAASFCNARAGKNDIVFDYKKIDNIGVVCVNYYKVGTNNKVSPTDTYSGERLDEELIFNSKQIKGWRCVNESYTATVTLTFEKPEAAVSFYYEPLFENSLEVSASLLERYGVTTGLERPRDKELGMSNTEGINKLLKAAVEDGYKRVVFPVGEYLIDGSYKTQVNYGYYYRVAGGVREMSVAARGILIPSELEVEFTGSTLKIVEGESDPELNIISIYGAIGSKLIGGTYIGDLSEHYYGLRVGGDNILEHGGIDGTTGAAVEEENCVRTTAFIERVPLKGGGIAPLGEHFRTQSEPTAFTVVPLWDTSRNTVDGGGAAAVHCYDALGKYLGKVRGAYGADFKLLKNTEKIKVVIEKELRLNACVALTEEKIYKTFEAAAGIHIEESKNIEVFNATVKNSLSDALIITERPTYRFFDAPENVPEEATDDVMPHEVFPKTNNLTIADCVFDRARRQGMSVVAKIDGMIVKNTVFKNIYGTDPQCGIDFESNKNSDNKNIIVDGCYFRNNFKWDIINCIGMDIEVKNCEFYSGVGATWGTNMRIHHNEFYYKVEERHYFAIGSCMVQTANNMVYNNEFNDGVIAVVGRLSQGCDLFGNVFRGGIGRAANIYSPFYSRNEFYDCSINFKASFDNSKIEGLIAKGCMLTFESTHGELVLNDCEFTDCTVTDVGIAVYENSVFDNCTLNLPANPAARHAMFRYCSMDASNANLINTMYNTCAYFYGCDIRLPREKPIVAYGDIYYKHCNIEVVTTDASKSNCSLMLVVGDADVRIDGCTITASDSCYFALNEECFTNNVLNGNVSRR